MRSLNWLICLMVVAGIIDCCGVCLAQPNVEFGPLTELRTDEGRLSFVNPKYRLSDKPESLWPENFNYTYPTVYRPAGSKLANLIIGDWGGELWFLPNVGAKDGLPVFGGNTYAKKDGKQFARPKHLLADDQGQTLLIGEGTENGIRYRLTTPGHLGASTAWTAGSTTFELTLRGKSMSISQGGRKLAETAVTGPLAERLQSLSQLKPVRWGEGIYGRFSGPRLDGKVMNEVQHL